MTKNVNTSGLSGPEGLVVAIILKSVDDLDHPKFRADALEYFRGEYFKTHLELLGLHPNLKPVALQTPVTRC